MIRYKVEQKSGGTLTSAYPHDPESLVTSIQDYLEEMYGDGWELLSANDPGNGTVYVFKTFARDS